MGYIALDTFNRSNQSGWGTASDGAHTWSVLSSGGASYNISGNTGVATLGSSGNTSFNALASSANGEPFEIYMEWQTSNSSNHVGVFFDYLDSSNYMYAEATASNVNIHRIISGSDNIIATTSNPNPNSSNTPYGMRLQWRTTGDYFLKTWILANGEPSGWTLNVNDGFFSNGQFGIWTGSRSQGSTVTLTQYGVTDTSIVNDPSQLILSDSITYSNSAAPIPTPPPITTTYNFTGNIVSQRYYKYQVAYVYTPDNSTFIDVLRDAPLLAGFTETISSGISPIRVKLPRSFDFYDQAGIIGSRGTIAQGNVVRYYLFGPGLPTSGYLRFQGFIDTIEPEISDNGEESVTITLVPFSSVLGDHGITTNIFFGKAGTTSTYVDPINIMKYFFTTTDTVTGKSFMYPLTWDPSNPTSSGITVSYAFSNQNIQSIFDTALLMLPANWYYRINPDNTVSVNVPNTLPDHTLYVGKNISNPQYRIDWSQLRNVVVYKGGNSGGTTTGTVTGSISSAKTDSKSLSLNGSTSGTVKSSGSMSGSMSGNAPAGGGSMTVSGSVSGSVSGGYSDSFSVSGSTGNINVTGSITGTTTITSVPMQLVKSSASSLATFGERINYYTEARIVDQNTLSVVALGVLTQLNRYTIRTKVRVPDYSGTTGTGYPIDSFKVGQSVLVVDPTAPNSQIPTLWDQGIWDQSAWDFKIGVNLKTSLFDHTLPIVSIAYGFDYVDLELDSLMPNLSRAFKSIQQSLNDFTMGIVATGAATAAQTN